MAGSRPGRAVARPARGRRPSSSTISPGVLRSPRSRPAQFVIRTAFLGRSRAIARDLTGDEKAEERLDRPARKHYLVVSINDSPAAYRYRPLFERFLP